MPDIYNTIEQVEVFRYPEIQVEIFEAPTNTVEIQTMGTPVVLNPDAVSIFTDRDTYYSTDEVIAVSGLGEYYNSTLKPIFVFEDNVQKMYLNGFLQLESDGINDPLKINDINDNNIFKITSNEIPVFKMHSDFKSVVSGGILFYNNEVYVGL